MTDPTSLKRGPGALVLATTLALWSTVGGAPAAAEVYEAPAQDQRVMAARVEKLLDNAKNAIGAIDDYRGLLVKQERFGDKLVRQSIRFKFSKPFKVYLRYIEPISGRELIYVRGWNSNKARAHKGSFPDITVNLNPLSRRGMRDNHHPITSFGVETMLGIITRNIQKGTKRRDAKLTVSDGGLLHDDPVWRIDAEFAAGGGTFTAKKGEDLWQLADRVGQNMYVILHHNEEINSPTDVAEGDPVFVPHYYASRGEYYFSKTSYLPVKLTSWDHNGRLYESHEYVDLELNPGLDQWDFDPRNTDYKFADQR